MRRRHRLHVDTFPFLAVLLCAMGALILILLIMDRRSRMAALARARDSIQVIHEDEVVAVDREADARLEAEQRALDSEMHEVQARLAAIARDLRQEEGSVGTLRQKKQAKQSSLAQGEQILQLAHKHAAALKKNLTLEERARHSLAGELVKLEGVIRDLQSARQHDALTYSVIPYKGKHGEQRRPMYVECSGMGFLFHPDRFELLYPSTSTLREEITRRVDRIARMRQRAGLKEERPYLMMLIRPEGIMHYYQVRSAIGELPIEFGYEFVDSDWVLSIPPEETELAGSAEPTLSKPTPSEPIRPPSFGSGTSMGSVGKAKPFGPAGAGREPGGTSGASGEIGFGLPGNHSGTPGVPGGIGGSGESPGKGMGSGQGGIAKNVGSVQPGSRTPNGFSIGQTLPGGLPGSSASGKGGSGGGGPGSRSTGSPLSGEGGTNRSSPSGLAMASGSPGGVRDSSTGLTSRPAVGTNPGQPGQANPDGQVKPFFEKSLSPGSNPGPAKASSEIQAPSLMPNPAGTTSGGGGNPSTGSTPPSTGAANTSKTGAGRSPGGAGEQGGGQPPKAGFHGPESLAPSRPRPLLPARIGPSENTIVFIECTTTGVVVHPLGRSISLDALRQDSSNNLLHQTVLAQLALHKGAPEHRQIRFLIHREAERTFHLAYPVLDDVRVDKTRYTLLPDDDVSRLILVD